MASAEAEEVRVALGDTDDLGVSDEVTVGVRVGEVERDPLELAVPLRDTGLRLLFFESI